jgi:hypothetical protein
LYVAGRRVKVRLSAVLRIPPLTRRPAPGLLPFRISRTKGFSRQLMYLELKAHFLNFGLSDETDTQSTITVSTETDILIKRIAVEFMTADARDIYAFGSAGATLGRHIPKAKKCVG